MNNSEENKGKFHNEIFSKRIRAGRRTYFFDVKQTKDGSKYVVLTESQKNEQGQFVHDKLFLFDDHFYYFNQALQEVAKGDGG